MGGGSLKQVQFTIRYATDSSTNMCKLQTILCNKSTVRHLKCCITVLRIMTQS